MIGFIIRAVEVTDGNNGSIPTGRELHKHIFWPVLPRVNELLWLNGNSYTVNGIDHDIDKLEKSTPTIHVFVSVDHSDFDTLSSDPSWEKSEL